MCESFDTSIYFQQNWENFCAMFNIAHINTSTCISMGFLTFEYSV